MVQKGVVATKDLYTPLSLIERLNEQRKRWLNKRLFDQKLIYTIRKLFNQKNS